MLIDPVNGITECPMEIVRSPLRGKIGVNSNGNPSPSKGESHFDVWIAGRIALPRPLELSLFDELAQFRNEPLH
jgi:hypothetical protein